MKIEELNLSEKIDEDAEYEPAISVEDVKEFIRRLKKLYFADNKVLFGNIIIEINKLAGDKLI